MFPKIPVGKLMVHHELLQIYQLNKGDYIYLKFNINNIQSILKRNYELTNKVKLKHDNSYELLVPYQIANSFSNNDIGLKFAEGI